MATITLDQYRAQYARNAAQLRDILAKAESVAPRKYRGKTADQWRANVATFERLATMSDAEMATWLSPEAIAERYASLKKTMTEGPFSAEGAKCIECNGKGTIYREGGDWGATPAKDVPCWSCRPEGAK
jgi:hypothetical protein